METKLGSVTRRGEHGHCAAMMILRGHGRGTEPILGMRRYFSAPSSVFARLRYFHTNVLGAGLAYERLSRPPSSCGRISARFRRARKLTGMTKQSNKGVSRGLSPVCPVAGHLERAIHHHPGESSNSGGAGATV